MLKMDIKEIGWEGVNWIHLDQNRDQLSGCSEHGNEFYAP
jgi:hypothetical protein